MERYIVGESANSNLRLSGPQRSVTGLMCSALSPPVETTGVGAGQGGDTCSRTGRRGREEEVGLARRRVGPGTLFVRRICRLEFGQGRKAAARMDGTDGGDGSRTTKIVQLTSIRHMYVPYVSLTRQSSSFPPTTHTPNTAPHSTWYLPPTHTSARCCQSECEATTPSYQMHIRIQNNSSSYTTGCKPPCALLSTRANLRDTRI